MIDRTLAEMNWATLMATQSMVGLTSPNFRKVSLSRFDKYWELLVCLGVDNEEDREAAQDIADYTSVYLEDVRKSFPDIPVDVKAVVEVGCRPSPSPFAANEVVLYQVRDSEGE
jgi:hypothetical protein